MGKLLKVLVVFIFLFSIAALVLGILNFKKKEMLIGRAHDLEASIITLAGTFEERDPVFEGIADPPDKDIDAVTDRVIDNPQRSDFWDTYKNELEVVGTPTMKLATEQNRLRLRQYYYLDAMGKVEKDPLTGAPRKEGPGTMAELLKNVQDRANAQYANLNRTRSELEKVRTELANTIREFNNEKGVRRQNLRRITDLEAQVSRLEGEKTDLNRTIAQLEREKSELNDKLSEVERELGTANENFDNLKKQYAELEKKYLDLINRGPDPIAEGVSAESERNLSPGLKGHIVHTDPDWAFVIVKLTDAAVTELIGAEGDKPLPTVDFMVRRPGLDAAAGSFVTRIRLKSLKRDDGANLVLADNLQNWEQVPVAVNDEVFF